MDLNEAYEAFRSNPCDETMEVLYPLVRRKVTAVVGKILKRNAEDSEELIVTYTTDVLMSINAFKGNSQFGTWIEKAVRRHCYDELSKDESGKESHKKQLVEETPAAFQAFAFDKDLNPPWTSEENEPLYDFDVRLIDTFDRIETVLENENQEILRLQFAGYTAREIGEKLGFSEESVWKKLERIRQELKVSGV